MNGSILSNLKKLIKKKKFDQAVNLAESNNYVQEYIELLSNNRDYKKAFKYLKKNEMDYNNYPQLIERAHKNYIRYLIKNFEWVGYYLVG
jgi:ribosome-interacting GTPase 1